MTRRFFCSAAASLFACTGAGAAPVEPGLRDLPADPDPVSPVSRSAAEWQALLPADAYRVLREKGTERAFSGRYWNEHRSGSYACAGCGLRLFASTDKFESGTGWPSFTQPVKADRVKTVRDLSHGMIRDEVVCARCEGHLGHVFDDGPPPTGLRYCMNSVSLLFTAA